MYVAVFDEHRGWRVRRADGFDICGAINEAVARETAMQLTAFRSFSTRECNAS